MCYYVGNEYVLNLKSLSEVPSIETESVMPNKTPLSIIEHDTDFAVDVVKIDTSSIKLISSTSAEQASCSYCFMSITGIRIISLLLIIIAVVQ